MAVVSGVLQTYGDATIKTDIVLDSVEIISAREDGIFAMLGKTNAIAMIHSYPVDTLATPASAAVQQGNDFTYTARTTPTLLTNLVQEVAIPIRVTRPQIAVQHYHGQNELDRQLAKGLMEFTNAVELISRALLKSFLINGESPAVGNALQAEPCNVLRLSDILYAWKQNMHIWLASLTEKAQSISLTSVKEMNTVYAFT